MMELSQLQYGICDGYRKGECWTDTASFGWRCLPGLMPEHLQDDHTIDKTTGQGLYCKQLNTAKAENRTS
ncbi:MAG: hypothetical protein KAQ73_05340, partial [Dehalococcoidia bacterium]|nr:hypothetical protein [Dehalococcoidia bacterium]